MDIKAFPALIVGVVVALVLAGAVLPVFAETTSATDTFTTDGLYYLNDIPENTTYHYVYDGTKWTLNDVALTFPEGGAYNVIVTDTVFIRNIGQIRGLATTSISACDLTVSDTGITGTYTNTNGDTTVSWTYNLFYGATYDVTDYIMSSGANTAINYVNLDTEVYAYGLSSIGADFFTFQISGNMKNVTVVCSNPNVVISNISINKTAISSYINLYDFDSITFDSEYQGTSKAQTYNVLVLPAKVTAEKAVHPDGTLTILLNVLPLLAIAGLVTGAVVWFINRKG